MSERDEYSQKIARRLAGTLSRILREFSRDYDRRVTQKIQQRGYADYRPSYQIVFANIGLGRARVTELAERAQITQQAMGKTLKELEALGYVERAIDDNDRRAKAIQLTEKGLSLIVDAMEVADEVYAQYAETIGPETFGELDQRLREAAGKLGLDHLPPHWTDAVDK